MTKKKVVSQRAKKLNWPILTILVNMIRGFIEARAAEAAASIAYYALFSLFPLLIFLIILGSSFLESDQVQQQIVVSIEEIFPTSQDLQNLVIRNIQQVIGLRRAVGIVGVVGLLWAATGVFSALVRNINRAWHTAGPRHFLMGRLMALIMVGIVALMLLAAFLANTAVRLLSQFDLLAWGGVPLFNTYTWTIVSRLIPWLLTFLLFQGLYRWIPNTKVAWSEAFWGALLATTAWELTKSAFSWYISSGLASQRLVYGSLGAVIALLLWIYLSSLIMLLGAHLSASITHYNQSKQPKKRARRSPSG